MDFFERVHNMLIFFFLSLSLAFSLNLSHSLSLSLSLFDTLTLTRSLIFSFEIQLEQFPLWKGEAFFPTSDFFPFASFFFSAQQKISLQSTVDAVDGRRSFAEWQQTEQTREKKLLSVSNPDSKHLWWLSSA